MLRVRETQNLLFDWAKEWRRGSEPPELTDLFQILMQGRKCEDLSDTLIRSLMQLQHNKDIGPLQIAAVIAAMFVLYPSTDRNGGVRRNISLLKIEGALNEQDDQYHCFQHGCILGLFKAVVSLSDLNDPSVILEDNVWRLALKASLRADLHSVVNIHRFLYTGQFSNILTEYLSAPNPGKRWVIMEKALTDSGECLERRPVVDYPPEGSTVFLLNELTHKIFGRRAKIEDRVWMVEQYLKHRE
jgi:hypothetical protein